MPQGSHTILSTQFCCFESVCFYFFKINEAMREERDRRRERGERERRENEREREERDRKRDMIVPRGTCFVSLRSADQIPALNDFF